jgi:hypothetical protein
MPPAGDLRALRRRVLDACDAVLLAIDPACPATPPLTRVGFNSTGKLRSHGRASSAGPGPAVAVTFRSNGCASSDSACCWPWLGPSGYRSR